MLLEVEENLVTTNTKLYPIPLVDYPVKFGIFKCAQMYINDNNGFEGRMYIGMHAEARRGHQLSHTVTHLPYSLQRDVHIKLGTGLRGRKPQVTTCLHPNPWSYSPLLLMPLPGLICVCVSAHVCACTHAHAHTLRVILVSLGLHSIHSYPLSHPYSLLITSNA